MNKNRSPKEKAATGEWTIRQSAIAIRNAPLELRREVLIRSQDTIKGRKGIPAKEQLMDRMDATELAANQFRMTQAREKLARDGIKTEGTGDRDS